MRVIKQIHAAKEILPAKPTVDFKDTKERNHKSETSAKVTVNLATIANQENVCPVTILVWLVR
jgi:hypothetical protein